MGLGVPGAARPRRERERRRDPARSSSRTRAGSATTTSPSPASRSSSSRRRIPRNGDARAVGGCEARPLAGRGGARPGRAGAAPRERRAAARGTRTSSRACRSGAATPTLLALHRALGRWSARGQRALSGLPRARGVLRRSGRASRARCGRHAPVRARGRGNRRLVAVSRQPRHGGRRRRRRCRGRRARAAGAAA